MKKIFFLTLTFAIVITHSFAITNPVQRKPLKQVASAVETQYTCSMHPEVLSDKPGKCPKCGMNLVKKTNAKTAVKKT